MKAIESRVTKSREPGQEKRKFTKASLQGLKANGSGRYMTQEGADRLLKQTET